MTVYVLHIEPRYQHAGHYVGFTPDACPQRRINEHLTGVGSPLIKAAIEAGCAVSTIAVFKKAGRNFERFIKDHKGTNKWCPACGEHSRPAPHPKKITQRFIDKKRKWECN